jgi:hypothetical protein
LMAHRQHHPGGQNELKFQVYTGAAFQFSWMSHFFFLLPVTVPFPLKLWIEFIAIVFYFH